ncbi:MAG: FAD-dependent oxidoreductase [Ruminococcaceae bacterium]|nr:FAD-dependent oxidoreductase [Oscillospiraceae bacterium]
MKRKMGVIDIINYIILGILSITTLYPFVNMLKEQNIYHAFSNITGGNINLFGDNQPDNVPMWSGLTVEEVTDYLLTNQSLLLQKLKATDRLSREVTHLPFMPQFRTTCHLDADYALKVEDAYKHFDDSICAINDFEHRDHLFEVPLRCITRKDYPNMLTAGRSAAGVGYAWDVLRVIPPAIITGQAAAHTACLAIKDKVNVSDVNISVLQKRLEEDNIMVHFPNEYVPEDKTVRLRGKNSAQISGGHM